MGTEFSVDALIEELDYTGAWKVTHWLEKRWIVRVTRKLCGGKISKRNVEYTVSYCKPNYAERQRAKRDPGIDHLLLFPPKKRG